MHYSMDKLKMERIYRDQRAMEKRYIAASEARGFSDELSPLKETPKFVKVRKFDAAPKFEGLYFRPTGDTLSLLREEK